MNTLRLHGVAVCLAWFATAACAIPSTIDHAHSVGTVHWQQPGSPPLGWDDATSNQWNHNHLTSDPFVNGPHWVINKAWDGRTLRNSLDGAPPGGFGHGLIPDDQAVRFGWGASFADAAARDAVQRAYTQWDDAARTAFSLLAQPDDRLAMKFERVGSGPREVTFNFVSGLGAYGVTYGAGPQFIDFEADPTITIDTLRDDITISLDGGLTFARSWDVRTPWSFDGAPDLWLDDFDIDYRDATGTYETGAEVGLASLGWNFGLLDALDDIDIYEMDFLTIALHEIGHGIGLGHTGSGTRGILRDDIAMNAHFGRVQRIDAGSALAVAIDYTYSTPAPPTAWLAGVALVALATLARPRRAR